VDQKTVEGRRLSGQDTSRPRATQNNPSGLYQVEAFGNSLEDSVSFPCSFLAEPRWVPFPSARSAGKHPDACRIIALCERMRS